MVAGCQAERCSGYVLEAGWRRFRLRRSMIFWYHRLQQKPLIEGLKNRKLVLCNRERNRVFVFGREGRELWSRGQVRDFIWRGDFFGEKEM